MKLLILILISLNLTSQVKYDTIISNSIYKSYFNYELKQPVLLTYKLYKGGGDCKRDTFRFINDSKIKTLTNKNYKNSGYDKGHLASAEDFAYNCSLDELTFRFYNCVPQTHELNRGVWKKEEFYVRNLSQFDSLIVICYNTYKSKKINNMIIPDTCYKFVYSLRNKKFVVAFYATNTNQPIYKSITNSVLIKKYNWLFNYL